MLSRSLYEDMTTSWGVWGNLVKVSTTEETLADKADRLGNKLSDAERANISRENPDKNICTWNRKSYINTKEKENAFQAQLDEINT